MPYFRRSVLLKYARKCLVGNQHFNAVLGCAADAFDYDPFAVLEIKTACVSPKIIVYLQCLYRRGCKALQKAFNSS